MLLVPVVSADCGGSSYHIYFM